MGRISRVICIAATIAATPAMAAVNLVTNGSFTSNGGNGQLSFNTSATDWVINPSATSSYTFLFTPQSGTISGTSADNSGATGQDGALSLWGPGNGSSNGLTLSPDGGAFLALDSDFQNAAVQQTINGLTPGQKYMVGFWWAAGQQKGFTGATQSQLEVSLGAQTLSTAFSTIPSEGFSGWMYQAFTFTATAGSEVLSFFPNGSPAVPPFALLDGVSMYAVPEPSTWAMLMLGFAGLAYAGARNRRRKPGAIA